MNGDNVGKKFFDIKKKLQAGRKMEMETLMKSKEAAKMKREAADRIYHRIKAVAALGIGILFFTQVL
jgi:hypothetical protein